MKLRLAARLFAFAVAMIFICYSGRAFAQATTTCPAGQWDMVDVMAMDQSPINANYHLSGTHTDFTTGKTSAVYDKMIVPTSNTSSQGKLYYVKSFQPVSGLGPNPGGPSGLYGYPWDINLYDSNYAYLWITEQTFSEPWAYKKFNSGSNDFSMRFVRRCVLPGDGNTSVIVNPPPSQNSTNNTQFIIQPQTLTNSSGDCTAPSKTSQLGWNVMQVFPNEAGAFTFHDDVHGTASSIDLLPVSYRYNCSNGNPGPADCGDKEEFDYNNTYGLVQWKHWKLESGTLVLVEQSVHDHLKPDDGNRGAYFPCF
jgi:hypothetical protein